MIRSRASTQLGVGRGQQRMVQHHPSQGQASPAPHNDFIPPFSHRGAEHGVEIGGKDPTLGEFRAIRFLAQIRLATKDLRGAPHRVVERRVFESMERIVVNKDRDRPLGRQQMAGMLDQPPEPRDVLGRSRRGWFLTRLRRRGARRFRMRCGVSD
jgi:hypothetical protein